LFLAEVFTVNSRVLILSCVKIKASDHISSFCCNFCKYPYISSIENKNCHPAHFMK